MLQKKKNTQSGTEFARTKEAQAAIMRDKQAKGRLNVPLNIRVHGESLEAKY